MYHSNHEKMGDYYYKKKEYIPARIEYEKALKSRSGKGKQNDMVRAKLGLSFMRLNRYSMSLRFLSDKSNESFSLNYLRLFAFLKSGFISSAFHQQKIIQNSREYSQNQKEEALLLGGTGILEYGNYEKAIKYYRHLRKETDDKSIKKISSDVLLSIEHFRKKWRKSPLLAGMLSAILPGSGQFYTKHYADGITSLFLNTMFLGSAAVMYNLENQADVNHSASVVFGLIGLVFYLANITGAAASAKRYNIYHERRFQQDIRNRFFNLDRVEKTAGIGFQISY